MLEITPANLLKVAPLEILKRTRKQIFIHIFLIKIPQTSIASFRLLSKTNKI